MSLSQLFVGTVVSPSDTSHSVEVEEGVVLGIAADGTIAERGLLSDQGSWSKALQEAYESPAFPVTRLTKTQFLLPGFVDTHIHAPQYVNAGCALDKPLLEWLQAYTFKAERRVDADLAYASRLYTTLAQRLVENGTTLASVFGTLTVEANLVLARSFVSAGLRGHIGKVSMDQYGLDGYEETDASAAMATARAFVEAMAALHDPLGLVQPVLTPRFLPTCSVELLKGLSAYSKEKNLRMQTHLSESEDLMQWAQEHFHTSDLAVFESLGLVNERALFAHSTYLKDADLGLLSERASGIAHCPLSNVYFSSEQQFNLRKALDHGVSVGLGSDISGGYKISLQEEMQWAVGVSKLTTRPNPITWKEAIYVATRGGAKALGMGTDIGLLDAGFRFDAQIVDVAELDFIEEAKQDDYVEKWWSLGTVKDRKAVYVQGVKVY